MPYAHHSHCHGKMREGGGAGGALPTFQYNNILKLVALFYTNAIVDYVQLALYTNTVHKFTYGNTILK